jgi:ankyrin repeat protein
MAAAHRATEHQHPASGDKDSIAEFINHQNSHGDTAMHTCLHSGPLPIRYLSLEPAQNLYSPVTIDTIRFLLHQGALPELANHLDQYPVNIAVKNVLRHSRYYMVRKGTGRGYGFPLLGN